MGESSSNCACGNSEELRHDMKVNNAPAKYSTAELNNERAKHSVAPATSSTSFRNSSCGPQPFTVEIKCAILARSFSKLGKMSPFAVLKVHQSGIPSVEVLRTPSDKSGHMTPSWNVDNRWDRIEGAPDSVIIEVWYKNTFLRNVFCGNVEIPCSDDMGQVMSTEWELTKKGKVTGRILATFSCGSGISVLTSPGRKTIMSLQPAPMPIEAEDDEEQEDVCIPVASDCVNRRLTVINVGLVSTTMCGIIGLWKCVSTFGLDEFLKVAGTSTFNRKIALAAKWPTWEFQADDDKLIFINHCAMGDLKETIVFNRDYVHRDGRGNPNKSFAVWKGSSTSALLRIKRSSPLGDFTEDRTLVGDRIKLLFMSDQASWGREFTRDA